MQTDMYKRGFLVLVCQESPGMKNSRGISRKRVL